VSPATANPKRDLFSATWYANVHVTV
jgi:hypothetical protein